MAETVVNIVIKKLLPLLDEEARLLGGVHTQAGDIKTEMQMQRQRKQMPAKALKLGFKT